MITLGEMAKVLDSLRSEVDGMYADAYMIDKGERGWKSATTRLRKKFSKIRKEATNARKSILAIREERS